MNCIPLHPTVTLPELGQLLLEAGDKLTNSDIKSVPFTGVHPVTRKPCRLAAKSPLDLAQIFAMTIGLAFMDKKREALAALQAQGLAPAAYLEQLAQVERTWPLQVVSRGADGAPKLDKESGLPVVELSASKVGEVLANGSTFNLLAGADLADAKALASITDAAAGFATHPVKLSVDTGSSRADVKGGYARSSARLDLGFDGSVSEQDFLTEKSKTLTCNAANQSRDWLVLTFVQYGDRYLRLVEFLAEDQALRTDVLNSLKAWASSDGLDALLSALEDQPAGVFSGAAQLFSGESPASSAMLEPLMPVSLPFELLRAKDSLRALREAELKAEADAAATAVATVEAELASLKASKKTYAGGKLAYSAAERLLKDSLEKAKLHAKTAGKGWLTIPGFTLMVGGSNPQNVGSGLGKAIHSAPVLTRLAQRAPAPAGVRKVFVADTLVDTPTLRLSKTPAAVEATALDAHHAATRSSLFKRWALAALGPLLALREALEAEEDTARGLSTEALAKLAALHDAEDPKALFVAGTVKVSGVAAAELFAPLTAQVVSRVKDAAHRAGLNLNPFDAELRSAAQSVVLMERR